MGYDRVQKHPHVRYEHKKDVELVDLVSQIAPFFSRRMLTNSTFQSSTAMAILH